MKKLVLLVIVIFTMIVGSCDLSTKYDITIKNNCSFPIEVYASFTITEPSAYFNLNTNDTKVFTLSNTTNNVFIRRTIDPTNANYKDVLQQYTDRKEMWTISYTGINAAPYKITRSY